MVRWSSAAFEPPVLDLLDAVGREHRGASHALMERYFTDVAADSGTSSTSFAVLRQYHDGTGFADYRQTFDPTDQAIVDTQP